MKNCVILAGGKSSRMGCDKALLPFGEVKTLTHFVYKKMSKIFSEVYVSAKNAKFYPPLPLISDESDEFSPMLAFAKILAKFDESVFIVAVDMPFVSYKCINELAKYRDKYDAVIAKDSEFTHNLCGFFSPKMADTAKKMYEKNEHKISLLLEKFNVKKINFENKKQFANLNNKDDFIKAENEI
ncbi:MAG: molybdenum cofactor guanylyltransferase [Campylobacter sp.]|nr:molybdenum cofactor guanylyltransferase [Campylobacter sp.]